MALLNKCCFCCSLKYGYLTYAVLVLSGRICALSALLFLQNGLTVDVAGNHATRSTAQVVFLLSLSSFGFCIGWFFSTTAALFFTVKGIIETRAVLMFPYIVLLILEILVSFISAIITSIGYSGWYMLAWVFFAAIDIYTIMCLISLYQHTKDKQRNQRLAYSQAPATYMPMKTV